MKKQLLQMGMVLMMSIAGQTVNAQCMEATGGLYPDETFTPQCIGIREIIIEDGFAGEYSFVQLTAGETYTFSTDISADFTTISDDSGAIALASGTGSVTYTAQSNELVRFYTHANPNCMDEERSRMRRVQCSTPPVCNPITPPYALTFEGTDYYCLTYQDINEGGNSGWGVNVDVFPTDFGANSMLYTYDNTEPGDDWFYTDGLNLTAGTDYTLTFKYRGGLGPNITENFEVKFGNAADFTAMLDPALFEVVGLSTNFGDDFDTATATFSPATSGVYYVGFHSTSEADMGYIQLDNIMVDVTLATNQFNAAAFTSYPNPVHDKWNFSYSENIANIGVYNLLGQLVLEQKVNAKVGVIDFSSLAAGAYIIRLNAENQAQTVKVLKK